MSFNYRMKCFFFTIFHNKKPHSLHFSFCSFCHAKNSHFEYLVSISIVTDFSSFPSKLRQFQVFDTTEFSNFWRFIKLLNHNSPPFFVFVNCWFSQTSLVQNLIIFIFWKSVTYQSQNYPNRNLILISPRREKYIFSFFSTSITFSF